MRDRRDGLFDAFFDGLFDKSFDGLFASSSSLSDTFYNSLNPLVPTRLFEALDPLRNGLCDKVRRRLATGVPVESSSCSMLMSDISSAGASSSVSISCLIA